MPRTLIKKQDFYSPRSNISHVFRLKCVGLICFIEFWNFCLKLPRCIRRSFSQEFCELKNNLICNIRFMVWQKELRCIFSSLNISDLKAPYTEKNQFSMWSQLGACQHATLSLEVSVLQNPVIFCVAVLNIFKTIVAINTNESIRCKKIKRKNNSTSPRIKQLWQILNSQCTCECAFFLHQIFGNWLKTRFIAKSRGVRLKTI